MFLTATDTHGTVVDEAEFTHDDLTVVNGRVMEITARDADGNVWVLQPVEDGDDEGRYIIDHSSAGAYHGVVVDVQFGYDQQEHDDILAGRAPDTLADLIL